jgi:D-lactate dehydrogenase
VVRRNPAGQAHQAFLTHEALDAIAATTLRNLADLEAGRPCPNAL